MFWSKLGIIKQFFVAIWTMQPIFVTWICSILSSFVQYLCLIPSHYFIPLFLSQDKIRFMCWYDWIFSLCSSYVLFCHNNKSTMFYCSPEKLHYRGYTLPKDVSSVVPSGVNNTASHLLKCCLCIIVRRILCYQYHTYHLRTNNDLNIASGFMQTICRLKSYGYPIPPPLVLECKCCFWYCCHLPWPFCSSLLIFVL
jgi:hypothetical protein